MALREINLIPPDILSLLYLRRHLFLWAGCLTLSLSMIGGFYLYQTHVVLAKKRPMTTLKDIPTHLGTKIEEIDRIQVELKRLDQQQSMLKTIKRNQPYSSVLFKLAYIMNHDTWLTQLAVDGYMNEDEEENETLELTGFSFSNEKLGDFMNRLSSEPLFKDVLLKYAREARKAQPQLNREASVRLIQFHIVCKIDGEIP